MIKKSHKPDLLQHPPQGSYLKTELKHTAYLKIIFNLYLKLWHLHFHAFPCKHKRKKKENQETHHIILKPRNTGELQSCHPSSQGLSCARASFCSCPWDLQSHFQALQITSYSRQTASSVRITTRSCRTLCTQRREMQDKVLLTLRAWGACCVTET